MKTKSLLIIILVVISLFFGCKKDTKEIVQPTQPAPTQLKLTILNNLGNPVSGAIVTLFDSQINYITTLDPVSSVTSGSDGKVLFTNLQGIKYYWNVSYGCTDNSNGTNTTVSALTENVTNTVNIILSPKTNSITMLNYASEAYDCYVNGTFNQTIQGNGTVTLNNLIDGTYNLVFKEVHYILFQTKYTGIVTVSCGDSKSLSFGSKKK